VHVAEVLSADTDHPADPSAKTIHWASSFSPQVLLCFACAPGEPRSLSLYAYVQVNKGLGTDTNNPAEPSGKAIQGASFRLRPNAASIATAPGTLFLFLSVHVAEGLSADNDHPAETSSKTFHGASSGSQQVMLCFASAPGEPRYLSLYAYVQVHKGLCAETDRPAQPYSKTIRRASSRSPLRAACITTTPGTLVLFHSVQVHKGLGGDTDRPAEP